MVDVEENDTGVFVFEDLNACSEELTKELEKYPYKVVVLGLDCEWVSQDRREVEEESPVCPVALLQLAFPHGRCFLIRLCQMNARLPDKLKDILEERNILKTGVGIGEDAKKLSSCYGLVVQGCVDLRHVASRCRGYTQHCDGEGGTGHGMSLSTLSQQIVGIKLDKGSLVRCSNWEAPSLSERQIEYAANDAIVAVKIFLKLVASKLKEKEERFKASSQTGLEDNSCGSKEVLLEPEVKIFGTSETEIMMGIQCTEDSLERTNINSENIGFQEIEKREEDGTESTNINSEVKFPSMFVTQALDRKSIKVYSQYPFFKNLEVTKGLLASSELWSCVAPLCQGVVDVPFKVKPKQKNSKAQNNERSKQGSSKQARNETYGVKTRKAPQKYVTEDLDGEMPSTCGDMCVVCGRDDHYMRKNVIPHDYRKHFPICMKDHPPHDVLLLCPTCHMKSTHHDDMLRKRLAEEYNAPLASSQVARLVEDPELKKVKCAAKALVNPDEELPANRREELYSTVKAFFDGKNPTDEMLLRAAEMETRQKNCDFISHGREVVRKVEQDDDLLNFVRRWRNNFWETMKPKYLPLSWTVDHEQQNVKRLVEEELKSEKNSISVALN